jgi:hypothetical protein
VIVAKLLRRLKSHFLKRRQEPTEREIAEIHKRLRELIDHVPKASASEAPRSAQPSKESETATSKESETAT